MEDTRPEGQGDSAAKCKRGGEAGATESEYNVSDGDHASPGKHKLRKLPAQSEWDMEWRSAMPVCPPLDLFNWIQENGSTKRYHRQYDETRWQAAPNCRSGNPHCLVIPNPEEVRPKQPISRFQPFTPSPFHFMHISAWRHYGNFVEPKRDMIRARALKMLTLVPLGGGRAMNKIMDVLAKMYEAWIKSLCFKQAQTPLHSHGCTSLPLKVTPETCAMTSFSTSRSLRYPWSAASPCTPKCQGFQSQGRH